MVKNLGKKLRNGVLTLALVANIGCYSYKINSVPIKISCIGQNTIQEGDTIYFLNFQNNVVTKVVETEDENIRYHSNNPADSAEIRKANKRVGYILEKVDSLNREEFYKDNSRKGFNKDSLDQIYDALYGK